MSKPKHNPEINLKGTLVSVFIVGILIIVMWLAVYLMYVAR
ncbi:cytochrome C oxidase subunit II [Paenisporosarcina macmurdoensis]|uniref:Cytochrome C oxidase subunit II n=1 Tax=Paenisporosarcina macmurdoensis TaxID=212659 RepID=A0ABW1LC71_9BACL